MTFRSAWQALIISALALSTSACLEDSESTGLVVSITSPDASAIDTTDAKIDIAGTASGNETIEAISWDNGHGESGTASGIGNWQVSGIPLELGSNTISVSATTVDGESSTDTLVVNRESTVTGSATLSWNAPTRRTDGTPLTNLAGYRIYYGRMSGVYDYEIEIRNPGVVTYVVEGLVPGDWYFAAAAFDTAGKESEHSNEVTRKIL